MPELNQNFIKGRMNKDLDERLVPNGEYRDAWNIEASTSEGSNVGTVQTLVGSTAKGTSTRGSCVGSIANEKTNKIYYLVSNHEDNRDCIIEYDADTETEQAVVVDVYSIEGTVTNTQTGQAIGFGSSPPIAQNIREGMVIAGTLSGTTYTANDNVYVSKVSFVGTNAFIHLEQKVGNQLNSTMNGDFPSTAGDIIIFTAKRVLNFDKDQYITGINIIDDFLFWTDNRYEPKQIRISRCIEGTPANPVFPAQLHTKLKIQDPKTFTPTPIDYGDGKDFLNESHTTVIKKSPISPPYLDMSRDKKDRLYGIYAEFASYNFTQVNASGIQENLPVGHVFTETTTANVSFLEGDIVLVTNDSTQAGASAFTSHEIRLEVIDVISTNEFKFKILSITSLPLTAATSTVAVPYYLLVDQERAMFEFKFPRFGYRYKYADGEYSAFSPFSEPAFLPSNFDYLPKKGFNLGMVNNLRRLKIRDFVLEPELIPKGVVAIDILYKESDSPNVYTVKTVLYEDDEWNIVTGSGGNMKGEVLIESEMIYATLPSNQLLRPWDNVPRKALGQEMSGNRLIYANYLQNYNLIDIDNKEIKIDIRGGIESDVVTGSQVGTPDKSIKSIRTYQLGIVYRDEYGRETPVLAPANIDDDLTTVGTVTVPKLLADNYNRLTARIKHKPPKWADTYKFFVKETSNEYYNLAMDRWYDAEDGNIWLSFPSSERNKIQEDTFLILKKRHDNDTFVSEPSRYKVIAIENEAPQYVKQTTNSFGSIVMTWVAGGEPLEDYTQLYASSTTFGSSSLVESIGKTDLKLRIKNSANTSNWYNVNGIALSVQGNYYLINLEKKLEEEVNNFLDTSGALITGLELEIAQNVFRNKPEFDGRFFVKIYKDVALETNILNTIAAEPEFAIKSAKHHFYLNCYYSTTGRVGRDAAWWEHAWERTDFFIDHEGRGLVGQGGGLIPGFLSTGSGSADAFNDGFWAGTGGNYPDDNGYGITGARPYYSTTQGDSNGGKMHHTGNATAATWQGACMEISVSHLEEGIDYDEAEAFSLINTNQYAFWNMLKAVGTLFRWKDDPDGVIYKIIGTADSGYPGPPNSGTNGRGILNYSNASPWLAENLGIGTDSIKTHENDNKSRRLYMYFTTSDSGWVKDSQLTQVLPNGLTNTDPDKYYSNLDYANKLPHWHPDAVYPNGAPPTKFKPTLNFTSWTTSSPANFHLTADSIEQNNINEITTRSEIGNPGVAMTQSIKNAYTNTIEIIDIFYDDEGAYQSNNPAIWETEPKENVDLDIYYEASQAYPLELNADTNELFAHYDSVVGIESSNPLSVVPAGTIVESWSDNVVTISGATGSTGVTQNINQYDRLTFTRRDGSVTRAKVIGVVAQYNQITLDRNIHAERATLPWFNCYSFGNGVESNRIRDDYNAVIIDKGPKASMTLAEQYKEERRGSGLIYSGIYNSISGVNNLNQFIMAEPITKDLNPRFGTIQKLHSRDTDVVALCEDKILKILANKDAVFNADGNTNLTATNKVLGQVIPYTGEYGISKNPESFAFQAYRSYFSDQSRGVVLRLSRDGLTPISEHGMKDFFADYLKHAKKVIGSYDDKKSCYNISLKSLARNPMSGYAGPSSMVTNTSGIPTSGSDYPILGHWFRYGGVVDDWAKSIENGAFGQGFTDIGSVDTINANHPAGLATDDYGNTTGFLGRGWTGIYPGDDHPIGINHGKEGHYGLNPGLVNPDITLYFYHQTQPDTLTPSFDATPNFNDVIAAFNIHGPGNVYLYQSFYQANFAQYNPLLGCTGPFCLTAFINWPSNWGAIHQPEAVYSIKSIEYEASSRNYKLVVNWLVGYSGYQDYQTFRWSLISPFDDSVGFGTSASSGNSDVSKKTNSYTVTFSDKTNGWVSFKSWIIDSGLSLNNKFYTLPDSTYHTNNSSGYLWEHRTSSLRNNFYGQQYTSEVEFLLNGSPSDVKSLQALSYSGTQSRILKNIATGVDIDGNNQFDAEYYNNFTHLGWYASSIETDLQSGKKLEFKEKEGKWFAAMQGEQTYFDSALETNIDMSEFSFQGIGKSSGITMKDDKQIPIPPAPTEFTITLKDDPSDH